jgi:hypothetical protein
MVRITFVLHYNGALSLGLGVFGWPSLAGIAGLALTLRRIDRSVLLSAYWHDYCIFIGC